MITTPEDYQKYLYQIQNQNLQKKAILLPTDEIIYEIDLNTRKIQAPEYLGVINDHFAEIAYFKVDRYFDNIDLAAPNIVCIIQYINKNASLKNYNEGYIHVVPYIDITTFADENKILFPWIIGGPATAAAGPIEFAIKFYSIDKNSSSYLFELNTLPATSKILPGLDTISENEDLDIVSPDDRDIITEIFNKIEMAANAHVVYWIDMYGEEGEE